MQEKRNVLAINNSKLSHKNLSPRETRIKDVLNSGQRAAGRANYLRYLQGGRLSASQAIVAYCYHCESNAGDGTYDCQDICCPLYPWHPYQTVNALGSPNRAIPEKISNAPDRLDVPKTGKIKMEAMS